MDRDDSLAITGTSITPASATPTGTLFARYVRPRDLTEFHKLQERNQERIRMLFAAFDIISGAPTLGQGYELAATALGAQLNLSAARLREIFRQFRATCDWRCLVDQALEWSPTHKMPQEFIDELNRRVDGNPRSIAAAIKGLRADWTRGKSIPGYGTWKDHYERTHPGRPVPRICPGHPKSWSAENLRRYVDSSKFRRKAVVVGRSAAAAHRPLVLGTRQGLWVHSHLMWDDVWHDLFVNSLAQRQGGRPLELFAHDYYSARKVRYGLRIRTEDDNGKATGLTGKMMRMLVAATYYLDGYSPRGTVNVAEHGTAAFSDAMESILYDASGGLITVQRSGMQGNAAHLGQYNGTRSGNPRFKASLESSNNLLHNLEAFLPGQTGPSRERRPEQLDGMLNYNKRLLAAYQQLPPDRAALLKFPILELGQYMQVLGDIYRFMEEDTEHRLEGWAECGHIMQELHLLGEWRTADDVMALPDAQREMALAMFQAGAVPARPRLMSRREVWQRGAGDLVRIGGGTVCALLGDDLAAERKVRSHQFAFEDAEVGPGEHRFEGIITDPEGREYALREGETYKAFVNPFAPDQLFVQDAKGRYLGAARRIHRVSRNDHDGLRAAINRAKHLESELLRPLEQRQTAAAKAKLELHRHNAAVLKGTHNEAANAAQAAADALTRSTRLAAFEQAATGTNPAPAETTTTATDHEDRW